MRYNISKSDGERTGEVVGWLKAAKKGQCWKGYKQVGMKKKNGRMVPNCVPKGK